MSTWTIRRVGDMARLINGHPFDSDDFTPTGDVPLVRIRDITAADFETYVPQHTVPQDKVLKDGDVVIGMDGDFNVIRWRRGTAALNQRVCALRDTGVSDLRFLAYALPDHLKVINDLTYSTTVKHLSSGQVTGLRITVPDRDDQGRIADYLDRETATIDALIEKQRRLVDGLQRRRRALLDEVWLRAQDVGARQRLKWHLRPSSETAPPGEEVLSVYRDHGVVPKSSRTDNFNRTPENVERYLWVRAGDVVVNKMKAWQGSIAVSHHQGLVSPDYEVLRPTSQAFDLRFLHYLLRCPRMIAEYRTQSVGIRPAQWRLYWDRLGLIEVPVPALGDQREIADHLDRETATIDALIAKAERFIELARERRAALITAAVTGQIEIPTED